MRRIKKECPGDLHILQFETEGMMMWADRILAKAHQESTVHVKRDAAFNFEKAEKTVPWNGNGLVQAAELRASLGKGQRIPIAERSNQLTWTVCQGKEKKSG